MSRTATSAILLLAIPLSVAAGDVEKERPGRLFFSPEQRTALDRQRNGAADPHPDSGGELIVTGEIRRSDGRRTRWINGESRDDENALPLRLPVGDSYHPATGRRAGLLGNGRIAIEAAGASK